MAECHSVPQMSPKRRVCGKHCIDLRMVALSSPSMLLRVTWQQVGLLLDRKLFYPQRRTCGTRPRCGTPFGVHHIPHIEVVLLPSIGIRVSFACAQPGENDLLSSASVV
jgi:hypothetical protein